MPRHGRRSALLSPSILRSHGAALLAFALLPACSTPESMPSPPAKLPPFDPDACHHVAGGPPGAHTANVDLARAHAKLRTFGPSGDRQAVDVVLADAVDGSFPVSDATLKAYAAAATGACSVAADDAPLGPAKVTTVDGVAVIRPGTGAVALPAGAAAAALDLRDLPATPDLLAAIVAAIGAVVQAPAALPDAEERVCNGLPDEAYNILSNIPPAQLGYDCPVTTVAGRTITPAAARAVPLAVLTGTTLAPDAALAAVALRTSGRAWIFGENVPAAVAESAWIGVGSGGLAVRTRRLVSGGAPLPDVIPADVRVADPTSALAGLAKRGAPPAVTGPAARAAIETMTPLSTAPPESTRPGDGRAALLVASGVLRTFYPYFDVVPDQLDDRLEETLASLDTATDRTTVARAVGRLSQVLDDAHAEAFDFHPPPAGTGYAGAVFTPVNGGLVVAETSGTDVHPGDTLLSANGKSIAEIIQREEQYISGSVQHVLSVAGNYVLPPKPTMVEVQAPDGTTRTVTVVPGTSPLSTLGMFDRDSGPLADLGAPDIYYVCLDALGPKPLTAAQWPGIHAALGGVTGGVVLDMRGYPGPLSWEALASVVGTGATGPKMAMEQVSPDGLTWSPLPTQVISVFATSSQVYSGKVVLLVGGWTQSQAEHLTFFYRSTQRGPVLGSPTSGADGTITGVQLPGGYGMLFTGMHVAFPDGSRFHGLGITPDVMVEATPGDSAQGIDTVLQKAIDTLHTM